MASDIATLGIKVENGDVIKASASLEGMTVASGKTEAATQRLTRRMALLELEARKMDAEMVKSTTALGRVASTMGLTEAATSRLAAAFGALSALAVVGFIGRKTIEETEAAQAAMAQLESAVASTGGTAGRTVEQLDALSVAIQKQTTFSDEAVKGAETMLLAFDKIRGVQFDRAVASTADLAARMGGDLPEAALKLGKALQDPEHGLAALRKSGISFSDSQIAVIKQLYSTGNVAEAQTRILDELQKKYGGAASAARDTLGGALKALGNAWGDLFEVSRGASTGTVTAINAITHALEGSGLSMNKVLHDATVDWETMRASIEKVRAIMALQIDSKFLENARNIIQRIDFDLSTKIAELNKPAPTGTGGGGGGGGGGEDDAKLRELLAQKDLEIAKQNALNAVIGASSATIALLNNAYDARAERAKNAIDHTAAETAALNKRTDALLAAKNAAVLEAQAQANRKQVTDVQRGDSDAVRDARQALELAGLSEEAAAQRRVDMQAENDLAAARLRFAVMTRDLDKEQADVAAGILQREQAIYDSTSRRVEAVRQLGHETAAVTAEMNEQKKAEEEATREMERRARELHRTISSTIEGIFTDIDQHRNPFVAIFENLKRGAIRAISDILATKIEGKVADLLGIQLPATKQETAAKVMNEAADKMLRAAGVMNGGPSQVAGITIPGGGTSATIAQYIQKFAKVAGAGYAGYQTGYGIGATTQSGTLGAVGGAVSGAVMGAKLAGPIGAAVGGIAGFVGGIIGAGDAARKARERMEELRKAFQNTFDSLKAELNKDTLGQAVAQVKSQYDAARQQLKEANPTFYLITHAGALEDYKKKLAELNELEAKRIEQLERERQVTLKQQAEDFRVRELRAQGRTKEADALAFQESQERERRQLVESFGESIDAQEAATLAAYDAAAAAERQQFATEQNTKAIDALTTSVRNAPSGFKVEPYIQQYAKATPWPGTANPLPMPVNPFVPPTSPLTPSLPQLSRTATTATAPITVTGGITITVTESKSPRETALAVVKEFDRKAGQLGGLNSSRVNGLEAYD